MKKLLPLFIALIVMAALALAAPDVSLVQTTYTVNEGQTVIVPINVSGFSGSTNISKNVAFGHLDPVTGTPLEASVYSWLTTSSDAGSYPVSFTATNGSDSDSATVTIVVNDVPSTAYKMSSTALSLGGESQKRSNPNHDDKDSRVVNITGTITITNEGSQQLSGITAVVAPTGYTLTDLKPIITYSSNVIQPGSSITAEVTMTVPENFKSTFADGDEIYFNVASITFSANGASTTSAVNMQAKNMLKLENVDFTVNNEDSKDLDDGDEIDNLKPDDEITMTIEAKNLFKSSEDVEIRDITARLEIGGDLDVDEEEDIGDLGPGDTDTATITFTVDPDAEEDTYDGVLTIKGTDENDAVYTITWDIQFTVERKSHEITVSSYSFTPSSITCDNSVTLKVVLKNTGSKDEEEVTIHLESAELKFGNVINNIQMDEGDTLTKTFVIPVPAKLATGTARVVIDTYYDTDKSSDSETAIITKSACVATTPEEPTTPTQPVVVVTQPQVNQTTTTPTGQVVAEPEQELFFGASGYTALLVLGYIVVIVAGIYLIGKVLRK
jgi:hypothetical protein